MFNSSMENKGFADTNNNIETPNDIIISEKPWFAVLYEESDFFCVHRTKTNGGEIKPDMLACVPEYE